MRRSSVVSLANKILFLFFFREYLIYFEFFLFFWRGGGDGVETFELILFNVQQAFRNSFTRKCNSSSGI